MIAAVLALGLLVLADPELAEQLKRDLAKVKHTIEETQELLARSRGAHFEADLHLRLAELFVEQSRYEHYLVQELQGANQNSPRARLLKEQAIEEYQRILAEWPDNTSNDKVLFALAHEYRELGRHEEMVQRYRELIEKYRQSELVPDVYAILGDYYFAKKDLQASRSWYEKILEEHPGPHADTAHFKIAWTYLNGELSYPDAFRHFEAAVRSELVVAGDLPRAEQEKRINIKHEAMADLAFTYTEVKEPKDAVAYFRELARSRTMYLIAMKKLADRYHLKEKYGAAAQLYREVLRLSHDPSTTLELNARVYEVTLKEKTYAAVDLDVSNMLDALDVYLDDWRIPEKDRAEAAAEYEVMARDLATKAQAAAGANKDRELFRRAAAAYTRYLTTFPESDHRLELLANLGDSLFEAGSYIEAGDKHAEIFHRAVANKDLKTAEEAGYSACASFFEALRQAKHLTRLERIWALEGLEQNGTLFAATLPESKQLPEIEFNIARSFYEAGELEQATAAFEAIIGKRPDHRSAVTAAELILDALVQLRNYEQLATKARALAEIKNLGDAAFKQRLATLAKDADDRRIGAIILSSTAEAPSPATAAQELQTFWAENKSSGIAEKVLYSAFLQHKEAENLKESFETAHQFIAAYPKSVLLFDVFGALSNASLQIGDFEKAAAYLEELHRRFPDDERTRDALARAGMILEAAGELKGAAAAYERAGSTESLMKVYAELSRWNEAAKLAATVLERSSDHIKASLIIGLAAKKRGDAAQALRAFKNAMRGDDEDAARAAFELGDLKYRQFQELGNAVEAKVALLAELEAAFVEATRFERGEWAVAALHRVGLAYSELAATIEAAPRPAGLAADEAKAYDELLAQQIAQLQTSSAEYFDTCVTKARELPVFSPAALGCVRRGPEVALPAPKLAGKIPSDAERAELTRALLANPNDRRTIAQLADHFLWTGQAAKAKLIISRGLELAENDGALHNKLGFAELLLGRVQAAYFSFQRASELQNPHAGANVATLMLAFKDQAGAQKLAAELSSLEEL